MANISIFAKRAFLNVNPGQDFDYQGTKPDRGYLKRVSSIIRADQIAKVLGAKLNPKQGYEKDVCIYVKPELDPDGDIKFEGKSAYLDIIDEMGYVNVLRKHPEVSAIVLSERDYINLSTQNLENKIYLIPQHHCNFDRIKRNSKKISVVGVIGTQKAFSYLPSDLKPGLAKRGIELLTFSEFFSRQDIINFYKKIDVQIVWRPYKKKLANCLKIVNAASFGIPTIALEESHFKDVGNCYIGVQRLDQFFSELDLMINFPDRYHAFSQLCLNMAERYHIKEIAKLYNGLK